MHRQMYRGVRPHSVYPCGVGASSTILHNYDMFPASGVYLGPRVCARLDWLSSYFSYVSPRGAFYVMAKYLFSDAPSQQIATRMLEEAKVITIPGGLWTGRGGSPAYLLWRRTGSH